MSEKKIAIGLATSVRQKRTAKHDAKISVLVVSAKSVRLSKIHFSRPPISY